MGTDCNSVGSPTLVRIQLDSREIYPETRPRHGSNWTRSSIATVTAKENLSELTQQQTFLRLGPLLGFFWVVSPSGQGSGLQNHYPQFESGYHLVVRRNLGLGSNPKYVDPPPPSPNPNRVPPGPLVCSHEFTANSKDVAF